MLIKLLRLRINLASRRTCSGTVMGLSGNR